MGWRVEGEHNARRHLSLSFHVFQLQSSSLAGSQLALVYIQLLLETLSWSKTFPSCCFLHTQNHQTPSINRPTTDLPNNISPIFLSSNLPQPFDCEHGGNGRNIGRIAVCKDHGRLARLRGAGEELNPLIWETDLLDFLF